MSNTHLAAGVIAAVLVCWCLGAYNRLVRLRQAIGEAFREVAAVLAQRHQLVDAWLQASADATGGEADLPRDAVVAACQQARAAVEHAAVRPTAAAPLQSLALAEQVLRAALAPWTPPAGASVADAASGDGETRAPATAFDIAVAASDRQFALVRERFNAAADGYNQAARQFPTRIVAALFRFRLSGTL